MICAFFGHRDAPIKIEPLLQATLVHLIVNENVTSFYVGHNGGFDSMVRKTLEAMKVKYPHIRYSVVLAYMPGEKSDPSSIDFSTTLYPDGLEVIPPRYAISKRNEWMVEKADFVVTYVKHRGGGAARFKTLAEKKGKTVINLA